MPSSDTQKMREFLWSITQGLLLAVNHKVFEPNRIGIKGEVYNLKLRKKEEIFVKGQRKRPHIHTRTALGSQFISHLVFPLENSFSNIMIFQDGLILQHMFIYRGKTVVWRFFIFPKVLFSQIRIENICVAFLCYKSIPSIGHNFLSSICSANPLCHRKAVFEMYHLDAALHYPAAKRFTHKLDTYFICSFHRFKLSESQIVFCTSQVILMNSLPLSTAASLGSCLH